MNKSGLRAFSRSLAIVTIAALFAACADGATAAPTPQATSVARSATLQSLQTNEAILTLQRVTAKYHDLTIATNEGFVLLHPCESRGDEGPVGTVYINFERLLDGVIDPASPDALIYRPGLNGRLELAGAEFAIPYTMASERPQFLGASFQNEDEFGVYALHAWIWLDNPNGMFAETNPRVSCGVA